MTLTALHPRKLRDLSLLHAPAPGRPSYLSAASGLVRAGRYLYVVADDEHHLGVFRTDNDEPGELIRLFPGELPEPKKKRKAKKPDLEALCRLPAFAAYPHGALLALGSGSRQRRRRAALLALNENGAIVGPPHVVDLSKLFEALDEEIRALNIEGAVVIGKRLWLLQRGNKGAGENAVIDFDLAAMVDALFSGDSVRDVPPFTIRRYDFGSIAGVPYCFSDGAALSDDQLIFTLVAENTDDNYSDGPCLGAAIGSLNAAGELQSVRWLDAPLKVEGIDVHRDGDAVKLLMVTDADDVNIPASLYIAD